MADTADYGPFLTRIVLGLLFLLPGIDKLMGMLGEGHGVVNMLWGSAILAWLLLLVEIICGLALLVGWKVNITAWPLVVVMLGAIFIAVFPNMNGNPVNLLFHLLAMTSLITIAMKGPGIYAVDKA